MTTAAAPTPLRSAPGRALIYMGAAIFLLSAQDAAMKWLVEVYSAPQISFVRYVFTAIMAVGLAVCSADGMKSLRTPRLRPHILRGLYSVATMMFFVAALAFLPLTEVVAIVFAAPLFMTALSVPMLGERVGWRRWSAIVVGFLGVLVILRPTGAGMNPAALLALAAALAYALALIGARQLSGTDTTNGILFYTSLTAIGASGAMLPWTWVTPTGDAIWVFVLIGIIGSAGQLCITQALRYGQVSILAPLDYTGLIWAVLFQYALWGTLPTWLVLAGAAIVVASSLYIVHRETVLARSGRQTTAAVSTTPQVPGGS